ncbi:pulmonary surfactant-associated protein C-like [Sceloporus undulatus]|uniref:pulmonary surfactant-associated protein C-like n=1 Tax=Sceloporus undulatus TaxID=8520 RepID=UPI001C4AD62B|nr:pulmonary surfactant-associated protein C-like [Sceloporus undulatus]
MEKEEEMEVVTKQMLLQEPLTVMDHRPPEPPEPGCCPCCGCCSCCDCCGCCDSCPSIPGLGGGCPGCGGCCPGCGGCCPGCGSCPGCCCCPGCGTCCRMCCCLPCNLPKLLCRLPKLPGCPIHIKRVLIILIVVVLIVVIIVGVLLMGLYVTQAHTETVLQMTIEGHGGKESWLDLPTDMEEVATFQVDDGIRGPAAVTYDFNKLLIGYKPWHGEACYITRMDKENVQGLDNIFNEFQAKSSFRSLPPKEEGMHLRALVDRSSLGTTLNILCSHVPIFWA